MTLIITKPNSSGYINKYEITACSLGGSEVSLDLHAGHRNEWMCSNLSASEAEQVAAALKEAADEVRASQREAELLAIPIPGGFKNGDRVERWGTSFGTVDTTVRLEAWRASRDDNDKFVPVRWDDGITTNNYPEKLHHLVPRQHGFRLGQRVLCHDTSNDKTYSGEVAKPPSWGRSPEFVYVLRDGGEFSTGWLPSNVKPDPFHN